MMETVMVALRLICLVWLTRGSALTTLTRKMCWEAICFGLYVDQNYGITEKSNRMHHFLLYIKMTLSNHETDLMG